MNKIKYQCSVCGCTLRIGRPKSNIEKFESQLGPHSVIWEVCCPNNCLNPNWKEVIMEEGGIFFESKECQEEWDDHIKVLNDKEWGI